MAKENFLIVINPVAGTIDVDKVTHIAQQWASESGKNLEVFKTSGNNDEENIKRLLQLNSYERVLVAGGDGTVNMVASILLNTNTILGILACGSANGLATSLNLPKNLNEQFEMALHQKPTSIDTLYVNSALCVHIADIGINAELILNYEKSNSSGMLAYAIQSIPTLIKSNYPYEFTIDFGPTTKQLKGALLAFANARKYGTGAVINPDGEVDDGHFEVVVFKDLNVVNVLNTFLKNDLSQKKSVECFSTTSILVKCVEPLALQIDGDYIGEFKNFSVAIAPKSLKIAF